MWSGCCVIFSLLTAPFTCREDFLHLSRLCVQRVVDEEGVYALLECMQADISMEIREYCAHSIYLLARCGEMGRLSVVVQKGLDYLLTSLTSERSPNVRLQAAEALVQIAPSCVDELIKPAVLEVSCSGVCLAFSVVMTVVAYTSPSDYYVPTSWLSCAVGVSNFQFGCLASGAGLCHSHSVCDP
mgnify:CR=1 FL=1